MVKTSSGVAGGGPMFVVREATSMPVTEPLARWRCSPRDEFQRSRASRAVGAVAVVASLVMVLAACGSSGQGPTESGAGVSAETPASSDGVVRTSLSAEIAHTHGLVVTSDGTLRAGTHEGTQKITRTGAVSAVGPINDYMGMSGVPGTDQLVASGHPAPGSDFPNPIGFIASGDGGGAWDQVSLAGEVDFHALATDGKTIIGFDGASGLLRSVDGGASWQPAARLATYALAMTGKTIWAATPDGLVKSVNKGDTFTSVPDAPNLRLIATGSDGSLWGVDTDGRAWSSSGGKTWNKHELVGQVDALAVKDKSTAFALTPTTLITLNV